mmetsp:Transcript_24219/g.27653  ORF Transcript_24219/g.27653 Transcript_24219/m.27653 type:complete len:407 (-) Transcript_24219:8-1228(-)
MAKKRKTESNDDSIDDNPPLREYSNLFTSETTLQCALGSPTSSPCIPCAYKICTFDSALDSNFTKLVHNTRPELCPRSSLNRGTEGTFGYKKEMNILTVGDGDFTFSLALARMLSHSNDSDSDNENTSSTTTSASSSHFRIIATSYESKATLQNVYPALESTIAELEQIPQVQICYEVDATNLSKTLPSNISKMKFHKIAWNFPCTAIGQGQDGQNMQMNENKDLVRKFVYDSVAFLDKSAAGEIHLMHKTKPPYNQWKIEDVALEGFTRVFDKKENEVVHDESTIRNKCPLEFKGRIVFDKWLLPPYVPRKALDRKSFPCHDACLYVFGWRDAHQEKDKSKNESTIPPKESQDAIDDEKITHDIVPVNEKVIHEIRGIHMLHSKHKRLSLYRNTKKKKNKKVKKN